MVATVGANEPSFSCITPNDRALIHANISQAKREAEIEAIKAKMHHISKENVRLKALVRTQKKSSKPMKNVRKQPGKTSVCRTSIHGMRNGLQKSGSNKSSVKPSPLHMPHEQNTPVIKGDSAAVTQVDLILAFWFFCGTH